MDIQTVWTDENGQARTVGDGLIKFDFDFRDIRFVGQLNQTEGMARLRLVGDLGPMPYSAESPAARIGLIRIVEAANEHLGRGLFRVTHGRVLIGHDFDIPVPVTATGLICEVSRTLLPALPYMELVSLYIRPPLAPAKPGQSALRPEWSKQKPRTSFNRAESHS